MGNAVLVSVNKKNKKILSFEYEPVSTECNYYRIHPDLDFRASVKYHWTETIYLKYITKDSHSNKFKKNACRLTYITVPKK